MTSFRTSTQRAYVTRRQMLRVGLSLAALPLFAACGQAAAPAPTSAPAKPAEAAKPALRPPSPPTPRSPGRCREARRGCQAGRPGPGRARCGKPRAGTGTLKMLLWQAPTILNPHLSQGTKDYMAARVCTEPLMTVDNDGKVSPVLAAEVPSTQNGGLGADGKSVTYKLKPGVKWADGEPFSADDVVFTFQFIAEHGVRRPSPPAPTPTSTRSRRSIPSTVKITFKEPTGGWYVPFVGLERPDPAEAHHEGLRRGEVPRGAAQHQAGRHRPVHGGRLQARRPGDLQAEPELPRRRPSRASSASRSRAAATPSRPPAPSSRPASTTTPGTSRSRRRCSRTS